MPIKKIENITVDGENFLFGGFIYDVNLDVSFGENYSTCTIRFINETGQYDISKADLGLDQSPSLIKIGGKIELLMYPVDFAEDKGEGGKFVEVKYVDESAKFLDKILVELNGRIQNPPSCIVTVGEEKFRRLVDGKEVSTSQDTTGLLVPDIEYNLGQLFEATNDVKEGGLYGIGASHLQNPDFNQFFKDYRGSLREVLTAWGNDLGFGFYWENGKVNIIDLTSAVKLQEVEVFTNALIAEMEPSKVFRSYSVEDTTARATNSFYAKDGNVVGRGSPEVVTNHAFTSLLLEEIPGIGTLSPTVLNRIKVAHYGNPFFYAFHTNIGSSGVISEVIGGESRTLVNFRRANTAEIEFIGQQLEPIFPNGTDEDDYDWSTFTLPEDNEGNLDSFLELYRAAAAYIGRFFRKPMTWGQFERESFSDGSIEWYRKTEFFRNTRMARVVEPFSHRITNYANISLEGFIEGNPSLTGVFNPDLGEEPAFGESGYAIKEREDPLWTPTFSESFFLLENMFVVEGNTISGEIDENKFIVGLKKDAQFNFDDIQFPSVSNYNVQSRRKRNATIIQVDNKIEFNRTTYPENFCGGNASKLEINQIFVNEEDIRLQGEPDNDNLSQANFDSLHNLFADKTTISKDEPYFTTRIEQNTIDLPEGFDPTIENGLQGISISLGSNGLNVSYSFGTRNMRLRNAGFYISRFYDARNRRMEPMLGPNFTIVGNALRGRIS